MQILYILTLHTRHTGPYRFTTIHQQTTTAATPDTGTTKQYQTPSPDTTPPNPPPHPTYQHPPTSQPTTPAHTASPRNNRNQRQQRRPIQAPPQPGRIKRAQVRVLPGAQISMSDCP